MAEPTEQSIETTTELPDRRVIQAPWLQPVWRRFLDMQRQQRLPHALMLAGDAGLGSWPLARMMAQAVLCERPGEDGPCGQCPSCRQMEIGSHPDLHTLAVEGERNLISVDDIRSLIEAFSLTRRGNYRVALIERAERMNVQAANALLKTLEEPPSGSLMVLTSQRSDHLPATIRSRVQRLAVVEPDRTTLLAWLKATHELDDEQAELVAFLGGPALYRGQSTDFDWKTVTRGLIELLEERATPLAVAQRWQGVDADQLGAWLLRLWVEIGRAQSGLTVQAPAILTSSMERLARVMDRQLWLRRHRVLLEFTRQAGHPLNRPLALERLAIDLVDPELPARLA